MYYLMRLLPGSVVVARRALDAETGVRIPARQHQSAQYCERRGSVFGENSLDEKMMESDINDPKTILVLQDENSVVGFTYALPESEGVACIVDTVLVKEYQNRGFISILMSCLETELRKKGYEYVTRDAMVENGYADKIIKNYSTKIVETRGFIG